MSRHRHVQGMVDEYYDEYDDYDDDYYDEDYDGYDGYVAPKAPPKPKQAAKKTPNQQPKKKRITKVLSHISQRINQNHYIFS